nr:uncharacterized protein LOC128780424 [Desmodus rotundus]
MPRHTSVCFAAANSPQSSTSINSLLGVTLSISGGHIMGWGPGCCPQQWAPRPLGVGVMRSPADITPGILVVPHWAPGESPRSTHWRPHVSAAGEWRGRGAALLRSGCAHLGTVCGGGQRSVCWESQREEPAASPLGSRRCCLLEKGLPRPSPRPEPPLPGASVSMAVGASLRVAGPLPQPNWAPGGESYEVGVSRDTDSSQDSETLHTPVPPRRAANRNGVTVSKGPGQEVVWPGARRPQPVSAVCEVMALRAQTAGHGHSREPSLLLLFVCVLSCTFLLESPRMPLLSLPSPDAQICPSPELCLDQTTWPFLWPPVSANPPAPTTNLGFSTET